MGKFFIILLIMAFLASGIAHAEELVGRDILIGEYGLEDSELLDAFIVGFKVTEAYLETVNVKRLYALFIANMESAQNSFDYLFAGVKNSGNNEFPVDQIARVAFYENPNSQVDALLFDFAGEITYFGEYYIYHDIRTAESTPLDHEQKQWVVDVLSSCKVGEWEASYRSSGDSSDGAAHTGWISWALAIEFADGGIRLFSGGGPSPDHFPDTYTHLYDGLWMIVR